MRRRILQAQSRQTPATLQPRPEATNSPGSIAPQIIYCYCAIVMAKAKKKTILDKAVERTAEILLAHFSTLPPAEAKAMRKEIHALAVKPSHSARRGKTLRSLRNAGLRPLC